MKIKTKLGIQFVALSCIPMIFLTVLIFSNMRSILELEILNEHKIRVSEKSYFLKTISERYQNMPLMLQGLPPIQGLIRVEDQGFDELDQSSGKQWKRRLRTIFVSMIDADKRIDQIRLIDQKGKELVRVDQLNNRAKVISEENLQNKSEEEYFKEIIRMPSGDVYISEIELNREFGKVSRPYKPVMRFATPVDDDEGVRRGLVIVNIKMKEILNRLRTANMGNLILIDQEGEFLVHPNSSKEFSVRMDNEQNYYKEQKELFQNTKYQDSLIFHDKKEKEYRVWEKIFYNPKDQNRYWILLSVIKDVELFKSIENLEKVFKILLVITVIFVMVVSISTASGIARPIHYLKKGVERIRDGNLEYKVNTKTNDELGELSRSFDEMVERRKVAEDSFNELNRSLEQKVKEQSLQLVHAEKSTALGLMAAGVAHELNNPMMGILNYIQYCQKKTSKDAPVYSVLKDAEKETLRCSRIVSDMLAFSRTRIQKEDNLESFDLVALVKEILNKTKDRIEQEKIKSDFKVQKEKIIVKGNSDGLIQVFTNLIHNAIHAIGKSNEKQLNIEILKSKEEVTVLVKDSGEGIGEEERTKIFDPFFTTKPAGEGTGLGLPICQTIIKEHGGIISFDSVPGKGTTFKVSLPIT